MEEFQTIPTKELQELVDRLLKKSEAAHEKYNKATEEYNQLMDRYYDCGDIIEEFKKRKGYDSKTNEFPVSMWLDKHRSDPDTTQEEKDAIEDIRRRFGKRAISYAILMGDLKIPDDGRQLVTMPGLMYQ